MGHQVLHIYSASFQTPKGNLLKSGDDPATFSIKPVLLSEPFEKYSFIKRYFQEREYGRLAIRELEQFAPDVVINSNVPLDPLSMISTYCRSKKIKTIFWWQDVYSLAIRELLGKKLPVIGRLIGQVYLKKEKDIIRNSDYVVGITNRFKDVLLSWGMDDTVEGRYQTIPNWAPIDEIVMTDKKNDWSEAHQLHETFNFVYTGTLSYKHNPELLLALARNFKDEQGIKIVVTTEGIGADYLKEKILQERLTNLLVLPFQDFREYSRVLGASDVLIGVLEQDAGEYSVPSKVLSYLSSGKPVLLAVPLKNLASFIIKDNHCGLVSETNDEQQFVENARKLYKDRQMRFEMGKASRNYAEQHFDIDRISDQFNSILSNIRNQ